MSMLRIQRKINKNRSEVLFEKNKITEIVFVFKKTGRVIIDRMTTSSTVGPM